MTDKEEIIEKLENPKHPMYALWCNLKVKGLADLFIKDATSSHKDRSPVWSKLKTKIKKDEHSSFLIKLT